MAEKEAPAPQRAARQSTKGSLTRRRILDAAAALLREGDPATVTIPDIAARAGASKGSVYYYFTDIDQILGEVVLGEVETLVAAFEKVALGSMSAYEALMGITRAFAETLRANSSLMAFVLGRLHGPFSREGEQDPVSDLRRRLGDLVSVLLERGKREGSVRAEVDSQVVCSAILGAYLGIAASVAVRGDEAPDVERIISSLTGFIGSGIGGEVSA